MDGAEVLGIVDKIDDGIEKIETEVKETVTNLEQDIEVQKMETQWTNERISNLERNQRELMEKLDSLVIKLTTPNPAEPLEQAETVLEEVGDDLEKSKTEPMIPYPFQIF